MTARPMPLLHYLLAALVAAGLALVAWLLTPHYYAAQTVVANEWKEMDLNVGMTPIRAAQKRANPMAGNEGILDPTVYVKILEREGSTTLLGYDSRRLKHNIVSDETGVTITIQYEDRDPRKATLTLQKIVDGLQDEIDRQRSIMAQALLANALIDDSLAQESMQKAKAEMVAYVDAHRDAVAQHVLGKIETLRKDYAESQQRYNRAHTQLLRQQALTDRHPATLVTLRSITVPRYATPSLPAFLLTAIFFAILSLFIYRHRGWAAEARSKMAQLFAPWTLTLVVWTGILLMFAVSGSMLYPLTSQFYVALSLWTAGFLLASLATYLATPAPLSGSAPTFHLNRNVFLALLALSLVITPLYVHSIMQVVSQFDAKDMLSNIRLLANKGERPGFLNYSAVINQALLIVALWSYPRIPWWQLLLVVLACLLNAFAIMEKGSMLFVLLASFFVMYERRVVRLRSIIAVAIVVLVGFYMFNILRAGENKEYTENETFIDFICMYVMSPSVAFCRITEELTPQFGTNTFEFFYAVLSKFGLGHFVVHEKVQDFVWVPMPTNVYTIMQPFYQDFGYPGVGIFGMLYGMIFGALYRFYQSRHSIARALYTYAVFIVVLQFYQDNFILSLSYIIQISLLITLLTQNKVKVTL